MQTGSGPAERGGEGPGSGPAERGVEGPGSGPAERGVERPGSGPAERGGPAAGSAGVGPGAGLCDSCAHQQIVRNTRGSVFSLCLRSRTEPDRYPRYPRVPVTQCEGWEERG